MRYNPPNYQIIHISEFGGTRQEKIIIKETLEDNPRKVKPPRNGKWRIINKIMATDSLSQWNKKTKWTNANFNATFLWAKQVIPDDCCITRKGHRLERHTLKHPSFWEFRIVCLLYWLVLGRILSARIVFYPFQFWTSPPQTFNFKKVLIERSEDERLN